MAFPPGTRHPRSISLALGLCVAVLLASGVAAIAFHDPAKAFTVHRALQQYRATSPTSPSSPTSPTSRGTTVPVATADQTTTTNAAPPAPTTTTTIGARGVSGSAPPSTAAVGTTSTTTVVPTGPLPGVYLYRTVGGEGLDLLGGISHTYPSVTTITVTPDGCGVSELWQPLTTRWNEQLLCETATGWDSVSQTTFHEFLGNTDKQAFTCDPGTLFAPSNAVAATTFTGLCAGGGIRSAESSTVVGTQELTVDATPVSALHIHEVDTITGASQGSEVDDWWIRPTDDLIVQEQTTITTKNASVLGQVQYHEAFQLTLMSLTPKQ